ncbi:MAG TPA: dephospho-CoA kinase, partial [Coxiellaceae bacterium]|nr:dephospho-CoA kinase [Coxiellaceae bacterium]
MQAALNTIKGPYVILDIPLLAESQGIDFVDRVLVIDCPESVQIQRLMRRDHLNEQQARQILTLQAPRAERLAMADDVIDNSGDKNQLRKAIERLHSQYRAM